MQAITHSYDPVAQQLALEYKTKDDKSDFRSAELERVHAKPVTHSHSHTHTHNHSHSHSHHGSHEILLPNGLVRQSFWNMKCCCLFSSIPDEVMLWHVFSFLDTQNLALIARVCSRWKFLTADRMLWQKLDLSKHTRVVDDSFLQSMMIRFGTGLLSLKLCNCKSLTHPSLFRIGELSQSLQEVHFCNILSVDDDVVLSLASFCPNLEQVSLFGCVRVTDKAVSALIQHCAKLSDLSLRNCAYLTAESLMFLKSSMLNLNVGGCARIDFASLSSVLSKSCAKLKQLNLHGLKVNDQGVIAISKGCVDLTTLHLSSANPFAGNPNISDQTLRSFSQLTVLNTLNLEGCSNITDDGVRDLSESVPSIENLNLGKCSRLTDLAMESIANGLLFLKLLNVWDCVKLTNRSIASLTKLKKLEDLNISSCVRLTRDCIDIIVSAPGSLRKINFGCKSLSDADVARLQKLHIDVTYFLYQS